MWHLLPAFFPFCERGFSKICTLAGVFRNRWKHYQLCVSNGQTQPTCWLKEYFWKLSSPNLLYDPFDQTKTTINAAPCLLTTASDLFRDSFENLIYEVKNSVLRLFHLKTPSKNVVQQIKISLTRELSTYSICRFIRIKPEFLRSETVIIENHLYQAVTWRAKRQWTYWNLRSRTFCSGATVFVGSSSYTGTTMWDTIKLGLGLCLGIHLQWLRLGWEN